MTTKANESHDKRQKCVRLKQLQGVTGILRSQLLSDAKAYSQYEDWIGYVNKKPTNWMGQAKRFLLKFDPKPSEAAFSKVFHDNFRLKAASDVTSSVAEEWTSNGFPCKNLVNLSQIVLKILEPLTLCWTNERQ